MNNIYKKIIYFEDFLKMKKKNIEIKDLFWNGELCAKHKKKHTEKECVRNSH